MNDRPTTSGRRPASSRCHLTELRLLLVGILLGLCTMSATAGAEPAASAGSESASFTLERCITTAVANSRVVRAAELELDVANQQVKEAWSGVWPSIDGTGTYTRNLTASEVFLPAILFDPGASADDLVPVKFSADNNWQATVSLDQPLFQAEVFIGVGAANRYRALRTEELRGERQATATQVRLLFHGQLLAQESVRLIEESIRRISSTLDEAKALNRAGLTSDYDVLRIDVQLGNLRPNLLRAQNVVSASRRAINLAMGIDIDTPTSLEGTLLGMDVLDPAGNSPTNQAILELTGLSPDQATDPNMAWQVADEWRTDLRQTRLLQKLARTQLNGERASYYPRLYAFGNYTLSAQEDDGPNFFGESEDDRTSNWAAGLRVELPIFQGLARPARVAQRRLQLERSLTLTTEMIEQARTQLRTAVDNVAEARLRTGAQRHAVTQARRGFDIASIEYREGIGSQLQVTDAENALRQSEFNYAQAVYDYLVARAELDLATGTVPGVDGPERLHEIKEQSP